jgi:type II secretory pathway pseudopilin PulG
MARQTIARMLNGQAAGVFDSFVAAVVASKQRRDSARKVVVRLLNMHLAAAFDWFCEVVQGMRRQRASVAVVIARWKAPSLKAAMDAWVEMVEQQVEEAREIATQMLRDQLAAAALELEGHVGTSHAEVTLPISTRCWSQSSPFPTSSGNPVVWTCKTKRSAQHAEAGWGWTDGGNEGAARKGDYTTPSCRGRLQVCTRIRCSNSLPKKLAHLTNLRVGGSTIQVCCS